MSSLPCPPAQWTRFSALLDQVMDLPENARHTWLAGLSGDDVALRPWLARVLGADAVTGTGFLRPPTEPKEGFAPGETVGPYRLEAPLGKGGMGEVWRARRLDDGPQREVALKLPHAELLSGPVRQRFARERDVLAALSHPHIAQLYDAGLNADGHPFLALELVEGQPITEACRAAGASLHQRMDLVREVLDALSYAHQRLIVHRDIKPSNVLVTSDGRVKLLDFGIAKLLHATETQDALLTQAAARLATPAYAAPEQFSDGAITVGTDIYAVGVLLFELCTGHRPFARAPNGPDAQAAPLASARADPAACGMEDGKWLARSLRGDMDAVIAKALAFEPADRYASAEAFERDLRQCRQGLPVSARRLSWVTRAGKFVRRNKAGVALATVLVLAVCGGTAGVAWQARRAAREAERANAINDFLIGLFEKGDPRGGGKSIDTMTAKELLDFGADTADAAFARQPETEMELLSTLGDIYDFVADREYSEKVRSRRLDLARTLYSAADPVVVDATITLATSSLEFKDNDKAIALLNGIRDPILARYGAASHEMAEWWMASAYVARMLPDGPRKAAADDAAAIAILKKNFPGSSEYPHALEDLATNQFELEQFSDSLANYEAMRRLQIAQHEFDAMQQLSNYSDTASALEALGRLDEAEAVYIQSQTLAEQVVGKSSPYYMYPFLHRAEMAHLRGARARADQMFRDAESLVKSVKQRGAKNANTLHRLYGAALVREGRPAEALPFLQATLAESQLHRGYMTTLPRSQEWLGRAYDALGRAADARALLQSARDGWMRYGPPAGAETLGARERWARFLLSQGETAAAATEFQAILDQSHGAPSAPAALAAAGLAQIAAASGTPANADIQSARALSLLNATTQEYDVRDRIDIWLARAESMLANGNPVEARNWAQKAVTAADAYDAPGSTQVARAREMLRKVG